MPFWAGLARAIGARSVETFGANARTTVTVRTACSLVGLAGQEPSTSAHYARLICCTGSLSFPRRPYSWSMLRRLAWCVAVAIVVNACGGDGDTVGGGFDDSADCLEGMPQVMEGDMTAVELAEHCEATVAEAQTALNRYLASVPGSSVESVVSETTAVATVRYDSRSPRHCRSRPPPPRRPCRPARRPHWSQQRRHPRFLIAEPAA